MESNYNNEDFEFFLQQKANQHKLYPSEKVWKNIYGVLHPKRKWFTLAGSLLILTSLFMISKEFILPDSTNHAPVKPASNNIKVHDVNPATGLANIPLPLHIISNPATLTRPAPGKIAPEILPVASVQQQETDPKTVSIHAGDAGNMGIIKPEVSGSLLFPEGMTIETIIHADNENTVGPEESHVLIADHELFEPGLEKQPKQEINWLQEMAVIRLSALKKSPFNLQLYFSPTISYRSLSDNNKNSHTASRIIPLASYQPKVDRFVDHKPAIGVELGSNVLFNASKSFILKTGLQLNYTRYSIKAYKYYFEKASIALNSAGPVPDTITAFTSFRNFNGYTPEQLQNQYLQVSIPVGAELKLFGGNRLQLNVAGTIQPSYLLYNDTYLLSTDYLNYAKEPSLIRKWNVNTSFEAFVSYKTGEFRWQVGPQFRYQLLSSFNDRYPIREYLMEYGVKFGVSKTLK